MRQSSLILAAVTTLAQRARSLVKNWSCSAGVMVTTFGPLARQARADFGRADGGDERLVELLHHGFGVPRGTSTPCQVPDS